MDLSVAAALTLKLYRFSSERQLSRLRLKLAALAFLPGFACEELPGALPAAFDLGHGLCVTEPGKDLLVAVVTKDCGAAQMPGQRGCVVHAGETTPSQWMPDNATFSIPDAANG